MQGRDLHNNILAKPGHTKTILWQRALPRECLQEPCCKSSRELYVQCRTALTLCVFGAELPARAHPREPMRKCCRGDSAAGRHSSQGAWTCSRGRALEDKLLFRFPHGTSQTLATGPSRTSPRRRSLADGLSRTAKAVLQRI